MVIKGTWADGTAAADLATIAGGQSSAQSLRLGNASTRPAFDPALSSG
jgi:hypothetical protein